MIAWVFLQKCAYGNGYFFKVCAQLLEALSTTSFVGMDFQRLLPICAFDPLEAQRETAPNGCEESLRARLEDDQLSFFALGYSHAAVVVCVCFLLLPSMAVMLLVRFMAVAPILLLPTLFSMLRSVLFLLAAYWWSGWSLD